MGEPEIFQNGNFANGDPVYQIGVKNGDGGYDIMVYDGMTMPEATIALAKLMPPVEEPAPLKAAKPVAAPKKAPKKLRLRAKKAK